MKNSLKASVLLLSLCSVQAHAIGMVMQYNPTPIAIEDYIQREKYCTSLGGKPSARIDNYYRTKPVVIGLDCEYNGIKFQIEKREKEEVEHPE